jgi:hypothetical protein
MRAVVKGLRQGWRGLLDNGRRLGSIFRGVDLSGARLVVYSGNDIIYNSSLYN